MNMTAKRASSYMLATDAEVARYIQQAASWVKEHPVLNDIKFAAVQAVSEYIANQDGRTLYDKKQGCG